MSKTDPIYHSWSVVGPLQSAVIAQTIYRGDLSVLDGRGKALICIGATSHGAGLKSTGGGGGGEPRSGS